MSTKRSRISGPTIPHRTTFYSMKTNINRKPPPRRGLSNFKYLLFAVCHGSCFTNHNCQLTAHFLYYLLRYPGKAKPSIMEQVLHGHHAGIVTKHHYTEIGAILG